LIRMRRRTTYAVSFILLGALIVGITLWRISKARCFQLVGDAICRIETATRIVALSFDDGPTPGGVVSVLKTLRDRKIKATFFLIGKHMARHPEQALRLKAEGHELGNHSFSHVRMIGHPSAFYDAEIQRTDALLRAAGETHPSLLRPPFGKRLMGFPLAVDRAGYRTIMWDVADDAEHVSDPAAYASAILRRVRPGSIILIHPMYRHSATARRALPLVLDGLFAQGYRIVTVSQLLDMGHRQ
jgi:peptidoglycan-N-acetylglucosamine deacetylase